MHSAFWSINFSNLIFIGYPKGCNSYNYFSSFVLIASIILINSEILNIIDINFDLSVLIINLSNYY